LPVDHQVCWPLRIAGIDAPLRMAVHGIGDTHISRRIREEGVWEPYESTLVRDCLAPGSCFVDVGANIGYFTVLGASRVGEGGRVFAFEPEPRNFALLLENIALNQFSHRVAAVQAALADEAGQGQLHLHPNNLGDHRLHASGGERAAVAVPLVVGAEALGPDCPPLDLVKIDVQGAEALVVRGLLPVLRASGSSLRIIVELTPFALREAGSSGGELLELLAGLDLPFAIVDHVEHRLVPVPLDDLLLWCSNVDDYPEDEGFMNIFVGRPV